MNAPDINQVKLRGTVADVYFMTTTKGQDRFSFTVLTREERKDPFGDTIYSSQYTTCVAWGNAAKMFNERMKVGSRVQVVGLLHTYLVPHKKVNDPTVSDRRVEIVTKNIEVIGFDDTFKPRERVEFTVVDDFSDLD